MELKQAKGNTWYLEDWQLIPLYKVDAHHCILLDTGLYEQRQDIEEALKQAELTPIGILGSHAHNDHSSNHRYFQQKYHIPVALPMGEAAICCSMANLKGYFFMNSMEELKANERVSHMLVRADQLIFPEDTVFELCGVKFDILHTPGHSPDHICIRTPDDVLYLADALLTGGELSHAKLPFHFCFHEAFQSLQMLRNTQASCYLAAHRGVYTALGTLPEQNIARVRDRADIIAKLIDRPIHLSEVSRRVCEAFRLRSGTKGAVALYERNTRAYLEYLRDEGLIETVTKDGIFYYAPKKR